MRRGEQRKLGNKRPRGGSSDRSLWYWLLEWPGRYRCTLACDGAQKGERRKLFPTGVKYTKRPCGRRDKNGPFLRPPGFLALRKACVLRLLRSCVFPSPLHRLLFFLPPSLDVPGKLLTGQRGAEVLRQHLSQRRRRVRRLLSHIFLAERGALGEDEDHKVSGAKRPLLHPGPASRARALPSPAVPRDFSFVLQSKARASWKDKGVSTAGKSRCVCWGGGIGRGSGSQRQGWGPAGSARPVPARAAPTHRPHTKGRRRAGEGRDQHSLSPLSRPPRPPPLPLGTRFRD